MANWEETDPTMDNISPVRECSRQKLKQQPTGHGKCETSQEGSKGEKRRIQEGRKRKPMMRKKEQIRNISVIWIKHGLRNSLCEMMTAQWRTQVYRGV